MKREETFCDEPGCAAMMSKKPIQPCSLCNSDVCHNHKSSVSVCINGIRLSIPGCIRCWVILSKERELLVPTDVYGEQRGSTQ